MKTADVLFKTCVNFGRCYGSQGLAEASLKPRNSSPPDLRPSGRGPGKTFILFGEIRASALIFCVLEKISFSVMEHWDLLPGVGPKNYLYNRCAL